MKYVVILGDGMSDLPVPELSNKTPLMCAEKPYMDMLAKVSEVGLVKTVPDSLSPGSDTANLSAMGYDPETFYTGRSPLEAVSMGIKLSEGDVTFRCNLVNLSDGGAYSDKTMVDYSSDEITTEEAKVLIEYVDSVFRTEKIRLYSGISYRHCLVWEGYKGKLQLTPPHDITLKPIKEHLPQGSQGDVLLSMMQRSYELLSEHKINKDREKRGLKPANSLWFWGMGTKPMLTPFAEKFGVKGAAISAVDLIKGIAICAGMDSIDVIGATGNIHTNFRGKADAALNALSSGTDMVYLHIEAPDECGHRHEVENKIRSIELIDKHIVKTVYEGLKATGEDFSILIMPDHPTPLVTRTHSKDPVPYILYRSDREFSGADSYDEEKAALTGVYIDKGYTMMSKLINR